MKSHGVYVLVDCSEDFIIVDNAGTLSSEIVEVFCPDGKVLEAVLFPDGQLSPDLGKVKSWWHCLERTDSRPQPGSLVCSPSSFVLTYWDKYWKGDFNPLIQNTLTRYGVWKYGMPNPMPVPYSPHPALWSQIICLDRQCGGSDILDFCIEDSW